MTNLTAYIKAFDADWNRNDLEAVVARFADDAVVQTVPPLPGGPEIFRGKGEIRGFVQMLIPNFHVDSKNFSESGDKVTWYAVVSSDTIRQQFGVDSLACDCEAIVQNGKVTSFRPVFTQETLAKLQAATNKLIARREAEEFEGKGNFAVADEVLGPNYRLHFPGYPPMDREGHKMLISAFRAGFPDMRVAIEEQAAEGDRVANRLTLTGAHTGDFQGMPPTGKRVTVSGINIMRFENGQIVELRGVLDVMGMMQQLGAIPAPAEAGL